MTEFLKSQMTPRLVLTLVLFGALASVLILRELNEYHGELVGRLKDIQAEASILSGPDNLALWTERRNQAVLVREAWERRHWTGTTPGIASAGAQSALRDLAGDSGVENVQVSVASDLLTVSGQDLLRFELSGRGDSAALSSLLVRLAANQKLILFTEMDAPLREKTRTRLSIGGYLPYLPETGGTD